MEHFFIEVRRDARLHLEKTLKEQGHANRIGRDVYVRQGLFQDEADRIVRSIKARSPRAGRSIFVLDQYGYSQVPGPLIRRILEALPGAEVILTFGIDSLLTYANDGQITEQSLRDLGLDGLFGGRSIEEIRASERQWRLLIQSVLYRGLIARCGAKHYTPFFIRNSRGHGDYWLIHMSQHYRARDVMTEVHWENQNHFIHYGGAGLEMFQMMGYDPDADVGLSGQERLGFEFDDVARRQSVAALKEQFPRRFFERNEPIRFGEFFEQTCNSTPASQDLYRTALSELAAEKAIIIEGVDGQLRRSSAQIKSTDVIRRPSQRSLFF